MSIHEDEMYWYWQSPNWKQTREQVFHRDGHRCVRCGYKGYGLQVHHRSASDYQDIESYENTDLANLETLCPDCHAGMHSRYSDRQIIEKCVVRILIHYKKLSRDQGCAWAWRTYHDIDEIMQDLYFDTSSYHPDRRLLQSISELPSVAVYAACKRLREQSEYIDSVNIGKCWYLSYYRKILTR